MAAVGVSLSDQKTNPASTHSTDKSNRRPRPTGEESSADARFFLSKPGTNSTTLELGREFSTEGEARVEALKGGLTYYTVQEWRPIADFAGRNPELKRESVTRKAGSNAAN
jgi:hypothetical protein